MESSAIPREALGCYFSLSCAGEEGGKEEGKEVCLSLPMRVMAAPTSNAKEEFLKGSRFTKRPLSYPTALTTTTRSTSSEGKGLSASPVSADHFTLPPLLTDPVSRHQAFYNTSDPVTHSDVIARDTHCVEPMIATKLDHSERLYIQTEAMIAYHEQRRITAQQELMASEKKERHEMEVDGMCLLDALVGWQREIKENLFGKKTTDRALARLVERLQDRISFQLSIEQFEEEELKKEGRIAWERAVEAQRVIALAEKEKKRLQQEKTNMERRALVFIISEEQRQRKYLETTLTKESETFFAAMTTAWAAEEEAITSFLLHRAEEKAARAAKEQREAKRLLVELAKEERLFAAAQKLLVDACRHGPRKTSVFTGANPKMECPQCRVRYDEDWKCFVHMDHPEPPPSIQRQATPQKGLPSTRRIDAMSRRRSTHTAPSKVNGGRGAATKEKVQGAGITQKNAAGKGKLGRSSLVNGLAVGRGMTKKKGKKIPALRSYTRTPSPSSVDSTNYSDKASNLPMSGREKKEMKTREGVAHNNDHSLSYNSRNSKKSSANLLGIPPPTLSRISAKYTTLEGQGGGEEQEKKEGKGRRCRAKENRGGAGAIFSTSASEKVGSAAAEGTEHKGRKQSSQLGGGSSLGRSFLRPVNSSRERTGCGGEKGRGSSCTVGTTKEVDEEKTQALLDLNEESSADDDNGRRVIPMPPPSLTQVAVKPSEERMRHIKSLSLRNRMSRVGTTVPSCFLPRSATVHLAAGDEDGEGEGIVLGGVGKEREALPSSVRPSSSSSFRVIPRGGGTRGGGGSAGCSSSSSGAGLTSAIAPAAVTTGAIPTISISGIMGVGKSEKKKEERKANLPPTKRLPSVLPSTNISAEPSSVREMRNGASIQSIPRHILGLSSAIIPLGGEKDLLENQEGGRSLTSVSTSTSGVPVEGEGENNKKVKRDTASLVPLHSARWGVGASGVGGNEGSGGTVVKGRKTSSPPTSASITAKDVVHSLVDSDAPSVVGKEVRSVLVRSSSSAFTARRSGDMILGKISDRGLERSGRKRLSGTGGAPDENALKRKVSLIVEDEKEYRGEGGKSSGLPRTWVKQGHGTSSVAPLGHKTSLDKDGKGGNNVHEGGNTQPIEEKSGTGNVGNANSEVVETKRREKGDGSFSGERKESLTRIGRFRVGSQVAFSSPIPTSSGGSS